MLIDNTNISAYGGTLLSVEWKPTDITTIENWLDTAAQPNIYRQYIKYSEADITILVEGSSYDDVEQKASNIISKMKKATLSFTKRNYYIKGYLVDAQTEMINPKARIITATYKGRKLAAAQVFTLTNGGSISVNGNCTVPATIEITPTQSISSVNITIGNKTYAFTNLASGNTYIVDAENGKITENGVLYSGYKSWYMPTVEGGTSTVTISPAAAALAASYKVYAQGRWI